MKGIARGENSWTKRGRGHRYGPYVPTYLPSFLLSFLWVSITEETNFPFPALPPSLPISLSSRFPIHLSRAIGREGRTKEEQQTNNQVAKFVQTSDRQTDRQKKRGICGGRKERQLEEIICHRQRRAGGYAMGKEKLRNAKLIWLKDGTREGGREGWMGEKAGRERRVRGGRRERELV